MKRLLAILLPLAAAALLAAGAASAQTLIQRTFVRIEPMVYCQPGGDPLNGYYLTDVTPGAPPLPSWLPQQLYITSALLGYQTPSPTSTPIGQASINTDPGRVLYQTSPDQGDQKGDTSRASSLVNIFFNPAGAPQSASSAFNPPVYVNRAVDSLHIERDNCTGGSPQQVWWQIGFTGYDTSPPAGYYPAGPTVQWLEQLNADSSGWTNYLIREIIPPSAFSQFAPKTFSQIQIALEASQADGPFVVSSASVGVEASSGDPWAFASTPVPLTLNGQASFTIPQATKVNLDPAALAYSGGNIVVSIVTTSGAARVLPSGSTVMRYMMTPYTGASSVMDPQGMGTGAAANIGIASVAVQ